MSGFCKAGGAAFSSKSDEWETPQALFDALDAEFHFTLDAASTHENAKRPRHSRRWSQSWEGGRDGNA